MSQDMLNALNSISMIFSLESVPRLVPAAASNILEGELVEKILTLACCSLLSSFVIPYIIQSFKKVEDADGEQNELKTLQGQV